MAQRKCPKCGSKNIAKIIYGMPRLDKMIKEGEKTYFAGCCIPEPAPRKHCNDCGEDFDAVSLINDLK